MFRRSVCFWVKQYLGLSVECLCSRARLDYIPKSGFIWGRNLATVQQRWLPFMLKSCCELLLVLSAHNFRPNYQSKARYPHFTRNYCGYKEPPYRLALPLISSPYPLTSVAKSYPSVASYPSRNSNNSWLDSEIPTYRYLRSFGLERWSDDCNWPA
jgi:hypothetical protein